jgi:hypothetical protein
LRCEGILSFTRIANLGGKKLEKDGKRLRDQVATLKAAIEEAIDKGQKSVDGLSDVGRSGPVSSKKSAPTRTSAGSRVAGWGDDF